MGLYLFFFYPERYNFVFIWYLFVQILNKAKRRRQEANKVYVHIYIKNGSGE